MSGQAQYIQKLVRPENRGAALGADPARRHVPEPSFAFAPEEILYQGENFGAQLPAFTPQGQELQYQYEGRHGWHKNMYLRGKIRSTITAGPNAGALCLITATGLPPTDVKLVRDPIRAMMTQARLEQKGIQTFQSTRQGMEMAQNHFFTPKMEEDYSYAAGEQIDVFAKASVTNINTAPIVNAERVLYSEIPAGGGIMSNNKERYLGGGEDHKFYLKVNLQGSGTCIFDTQDEVGVLPADLTPTWELIESAIYWERSENVAAHSADIARLASQPLTQVQQHTVDGADIAFTPVAGPNTITLGTEHRTTSQALTWAVITQEQKDNGGERDLLRYGALQGFRHDINGQSSEAHTADSYRMAFNQLETRHAFQARAQPRHDGSARNQYMLHFSSKPNVLVGADGSTHGSTPIDLQGSTIKLLIEVPAALVGVPCVLKTCTMATEIVSTVRNASGLKISRRVLGAARV